MLARAQGLRIPPEEDFCRVYSERAESRSVSLSERTVRAPSAQPYEGHGERRSERVERVGESSRGSLSLRQVRAGPTVSGTTASVSERVRKRRISETRTVSGSSSGATNMSEVSVVASNSDNAASSSRVRDANPFLK